MVPAALGRYLFSAILSRTGWKRVKPTGWKQAAMHVGITTQISVCKL